MLPIWGGDCIFQTQQRSRIPVFVAKRNCALTVKSKIMSILEQLYFNYKIQLSADDTVPFEFLAVISIISLILSLAITWRHLFWWLLPFLLFISFLTPLFFWHWFTAFKTGKQPEYLYLVSLADQCSDSTKHIRASQEIAGPPQNVACSPDVQDPSS